MEIKFKENGYVNNKSEVINELHSRVHIGISEYQDAKYEDIINFLNNPEDELNYFDLFKCFFDYRLLEEDLLEYINLKEKKNYTKFIMIPVDEMMLDECLDDILLYQLGIEFACDESFILEERNYTMNELKQLVKKKIISPVEKKNIKISSKIGLTNIKVYQRKLDKFNYLYDLSSFNDYFTKNSNLYKNKKRKSKVEYYEFFIKKLKEVVDINTLMLIARRKIISLYVNALINYNNEATSQYMKKYYANNINKIKVLVEKYNDYALINNLELISENEFDIYLDGFRDNTGTTNYLYSFNDFLFKRNLTYDEILKLKKAGETNNYLLHNIGNYFYPENFVDKLILSKNDENNALRCLIDFKVELDFLTKCKLLRVILNSGNKEVIDLVVEDGLLSESNVKKYINKRK